MNNPSSHIDNSILIEAIEGMTKYKTEESTNIFINSLINAQFIVPITVPVEDTALNKDGSRTLKKDININLKLITNETGQEYLVVFSDWQQVENWDEDENEGVVLDFPSLADTVASKEQICGFVINPFSTNFIMNKDKIAIIRDALVIPKKSKE